MRKVKWTDVVTHFSSG